MPSGRTHAAFTAAAIVVTYSAASLRFDQQIALELAAGVALGFVIEPDLDVPHRTYSEALMTRVPLFGPVLGAAWQMLWTPYALIPHRSPLSHLPVLSDALRWLYLAVAGSLVLIVVSRFDVDIAAVLPAINLERLSMLFAGNCIATTIHFLADTFSSAAKRRRRRRRARR